ncbi:MAG: hypothetical protein KDE31_37840, partial [Caldilineaceae bacterium]|nr:hypothetical protein [Caldilineaceae bacterium]
FTNLVVHPIINLINLVIPQTAVKLPVRISTTITSPRTSLADMAWATKQGASERLRSVRSVIAHGGRVREVTYATLAARSCRRASEYVNVHALRLFNDEPTHGSGIT